MIMQMEVEPTRRKGESFFVLFAVPVHRREISRMVSENLYAR